MACVVTPWKSSKSSSASHTVSWPSGSCGRVVTSVTATKQGRGRTHSTVRHVRSRDVHDTRRRPLAEGRMLQGALGKDTAQNREMGRLTPRASNRTSAACSPKLSATPCANLNGVTGSYCMRRRENVSHKSAMGGWRCDALCYR